MFQHDLRGWAQIADSLSLWSYPINYGTFGQFKPWPSWWTTAQNIQFSASKNVSWIFLESTLSRNGAGGLGLEMEPLRACESGLATVQYCTDAPVTRAASTHSSIH